MTPTNPAQHTHIAADALDRLMQDLRAGRAQWSHPHAVRQAADDLIRISDAMATTVQQMAAALTELAMVPPGPSAGQVRQSVGALHLAGQAQATAAQHLRQARRTMH
jgi:glutamine synthetase adenylyltransferase